MTSRLTGFMFLGSTAFLWAGVEAYDDISLIEEPAAETSRGFCDGLKDIGKLYSDAENPWIQEFGLKGRWQFQGAYVDGVDEEGDDFNYLTDEVRRFFFGGGVKFLQYFELSSQAVLYQDNEPSGGEGEFEFVHLWDGYLKFDAGKALGIESFDTLSVGYGKREVNMSAEWNISSRFIKTVERSAISNKIWPSDTDFSNPTGGWVEFKKDELDARLGIFSTSEEEWLAPWRDGQLYYGRLKYDLTGVTGTDTSHLLWTGFYQDVDSDDDVLGGGIEWATSLSLTYGQGPWQFLVEGIYGDNGEQPAEQEGAFYGFVFLPSVWLVKDRLEAVGRYQYQGSEESRGSRLNSRYARRAESADRADISSGRGDSHHSFYAGLNYYICGDNTKILVGVEYDDLESEGEDVYEGWTTFLGFRTYF